MSRVFETPDLIIQGGTLLTMADDQLPIQDGCVLIAGDKIMDIVSKKDLGCMPHNRVPVIHAHNAVVMPGLINAHTHLAMTLFRGYADDLPLRQWLFEKIFPAESTFLTPETVYWGACLACLEMIASGTTCMADGYFFQDATVQAVDESGLRGLIGQGVLDLPAPGIEDPAKNVKTAEEFLDKWHGFSKRITPGIFCHSPLTCSESTLKQSHELSKAFQVPLQIHLSETQAEVAEILKKTGDRPVHYLDRIGILSHKLVAAHAVHLDDREMACIRDKGVNLVHLPESNMKLGSGTSRVAHMLRMGIRIGLGTDGCASNNNMDLFGEMDAAAKIGKVMAMDPTCLDAATVLRMATCHGAAVLGLEKEIGTIEKGKKADIIVVDTNAPHLCPVYDPVSALVYSAGGGDVRDVVVNGKVLMADREFLTLDPRKIILNIRKIGDKVKSNI